MDRFDITEGTHITGITPQSVKNICQDFMDCGTIRNRHHLHLNITCSHHDIADLVLNNNHPSIYPYIMEETRVQVSKIYVKISWTVGLYITDSIISPHHRL
jgi:hypothetical protein